MQLSGHFCILFLLVVVSKKKIFSTAGKKVSSGLIEVKAAVLHEANTPFVVEAVQLQPPKAEEVLVKIVAVGVCHSDWHVASGATEHPFPVICGHEGAGIVEAVGKDITTLKRGDAVALNWAPFCGTCFYCLRGKPSLCQEYTETIWAGTMSDKTTRFKSSDGQSIYHFTGLGCFAEKCVVSASSCVPLSSKLPFPVAALIGCAVTTGVGSVLNTAKVEPCSSVAVFGCGGVGLSTIIGAKLAGASQIIAVDIVEEKTKMAKDFGATSAVVYQEDGENVVEEIRKLTAGRGADYVFEAIGIPSVQEKALEAVRPGGSLVLSGLAKMGTTAAIPTSLITRQEKSIIGSYYGTCNTARDFPLYADIHLNKQFDLSKLITKTYQLEEINEAYKDMLEGRVARGIILFEDPDHDVVEVSLSET